MNWFWRPSLRILASNVPHDGLTNRKTNRFAHNSMAFYMDKNSK